MHGFSQLNCAFCLIIAFLQEMVKVSQHFVRGNQPELYAKIVVDCMHRVFLFVPDHLSPYNRVTGKCKYAGPDSPYGHSAFLCIIGISYQEEIFLLCSNVAEEG